MSRRKRQSAYEEAIEAFSKLPWQTCLILAVVSWIGFHWMAQIKPPEAHNINEMGHSVGITLIKTMGMFMQYLAPIGLFLAALTSWLGKQRRQKLLNEAESRTSSNHLQQLSWRQFEQLVGAYFEKQGYLISFTPNGADGGVDIVAKKGKEIFLVQCKHWKSTQIGVSVVRELFGVMSAQGATGAYVVSIGPFSPDAHAFVEGRNIVLVDANTVIRSSGAKNVGSVGAAARNTTAQSPACPNCGSSMVRRVAKHGANAGNPFYGCSAYPQCRGTLSI